jgi:hypothetical protein
MLQFIALKKHHGRNCQLCEACEHDVNSQNSAFDRDLVHRMEINMCCVIISKQLRSYYKNLKSSQAPKNTFEGTKKWSLQAYGCWFLCYIIIIIYLEYCSRRLLLVVMCCSSLSKDEGERDSTPYASLKEYILTQVGVALPFRFASVRL